MVGDSIDLTSLLSVGHNRASNCYIYVYVVGARTCAKLKRNTGMLGPWKNGARRPSRVQRRKWLQSASDSQHSAAQSSIVHIDHGDIRALMVTGRALPAIMIFRHVDDKRARDFRCPKALRTLS